MSKINYIDDLKTWKKSFSYSEEIVVRFSETDMFGHMNNTSAFVYFEQGRINYLKEKGLLNLDDNTTTMPVVADLQCDFIQQIYFDERLTLYIKTNSIGTSSLDIHYLAVNEVSQVCLTGRGTLVYIDVKTNKAVPIPINLRHKLVE